MAVRPSETFPYLADKQDFALFLGRFHPEKAPHLAIDAARAAQIPIILARKMLQAGRARLLQSGNRAEDRPGRAADHII